MNKLNQNRKILITGASGFLGNELFKMLKSKYDVYGSSRSESNSRIFTANLAEETDLKSLQDTINPEIIIHAAGLKDIKKCEQDPELAHLTNVKLTENLCNHFKKSKIIYISTDYVFNGKTGMFKEDDTPNPSTVYGKTKRLGEEIGIKKCPNNFKIIRTASIYSKTSSFINFLNKMIDNDSSFDAYYNCIFSPTSINHLISAIDKLIKNDYKNNIFHVAGRPISRYEFAKKYYQICNGDIRNIIKSKNKKDKFLFEDLSLSTNKTDSILNLTSIEIEEALSNIRVQSAASYIK